MKRRSDEEISAPLYAYDADVRAQYGCFAGVDEAGRGPLCGPVCVAACILDPEHPVYGINDSKKLTEKKREALFDEIVEKALAYKIVFVGPCAAKKLEAQRRSVKSEVDFVLTFEEMAGIFEARHIDVNTLKDDPHGVNDASADGRNFAVSGGVAQAVVNVIKEKYPELTDVVWPA